MANVRDFRQATLDFASTGCKLITPDDNNDLADFAVGLRIYNPNATVATIKIDTVRGDTITLSVPAGSLISEPIYTARVYSTGTTVELIIHGYF